MRWRGLSLVLVCGLASGCLVSFDGYRSGLETGGAGQGADGASAGDASGGSGGKGSGGKTSAGASNGGDAGQPIEGGESGSGGAVSGGSAGNAPGGSDPGGNAGSGGGGSGGGGSGGGGNGGSGGTPPKSCPLALAGPAMIEVLKNDGTIYCIDRTEVPNEDYAVFLATAPGTAGQIAACTWNLSYQPDTSTNCASALGAYDPEARPRVPVSCIDWCDAKRYCEWAGKRLCGNIGGGSNPPQDYDNAEDSQWYRACSRAGSRIFPYAGAQYQANYCNGVDSPYIHPASVANAPNCEGGYTGIFDMSGNVAEWEDSCTGNAGANDPCLHRGGSLQDAQTTVPSLLCNSSAINDNTPSYVSATRNTQDEFIGFRCCYDP